MTIPGTDSETDGTTQETETLDGTNDQTAANGEGSGETTPSSDGYDEDFLRKLDTFDPSKVDPASLPKGFNDRFIPKSEFTRKTQALAEEKRAIAEREKAVFELARKSIEGRDKTPAGPTPQEQKRQELLSLATAGDPEALSALIKMEAQAITAPMEEDRAIRRAAEAARASDPAVVKHWDSIIHTLSTDPVINELASQNGHKYADKVMLALAIEAERNELRTALPARDAEIASLKAKLSTYEKERVTSLPPSTTRAGVTAGRPAVGEANNINEAAYAAWIESGGRREDFR